MKKPTTFKNKITKTHYVYKITNKLRNVYYIGSRTGRVADPLDDLGRIYFTSGVLREHFIDNPDDYEREIIQQFATRKEADIFEQNLIALHFNNPLCANKRVTNCALLKPQNVNAPQKKTKSKKKAVNRIQMEQRVKNYDTSHIVFPSKPKKARSDMIWCDTAQTFVPMTKSQAKKTAKALSKARWERGGRI